jgi:hypothetical protein
MNWKLHGNQFGTLLKIKFFGTMKPLWQSPHAKKNKIDWLQKQINKLHQLQGKGFSDNVQNV